jgi:predicted CoA-binding protein
MRSVLRRVEENANQRALPSDVRKGSAFPASSLLFRRLRLRQLDQEAQPHQETNHTPERPSLSAHQAAKPQMSIHLEINSSETIKHILDECRTIAVVGLSSKPTRPSHGVAGYMQRAGYRIIPVNPNETEVLGESAYDSLAEVHEKIDLVDVFRRSDEAGAAVDEAIAVGAKAVWLQEGVIDHEAAQRALEAGLLVVMDRCWLKEHVRRQK